MFSPDGQTLASGSSSWAGGGDIYLWDMETREYLKALTGHTDEVNSMSFSLDGQTLASGSSDGTILLWDFTSALPKTDNLKGEVNGDGVINIQD